MKSTDRAIIPQPEPTAASTVLVVVELLCLSASAPFLQMAAYFVGKTFGILGANDNSTLVYAVVAVIYATPGVLLLAIALAARTRGRLGDSPSARRRWSPGRRLASLRPPEWAWAAVALTVGMVLWRLYVASLT